MGLMMNWRERMRKKNLVMMFAGAVLLSLAIIPLARAERGVTDTEIRIGQWGPQTGPAALWGAVGRGTGCYFDMINAEGGIHGRKITYYLRDDGYMAPKTKAIAKELLENKKVFAFASGVGTAPGMAVKKYLQKNKVPWVGAASGSHHWAYPPTKYIFAVYPLYCDEAAILVDHAVKELGKKRIAFFYLNDDYGKMGLIGAELALKKYNMELVEAVSAEIMDSELSSHCLRLKEADPDCVIIFLIPKQAAIFLVTAAKMDFKPLFMSTSTCSDTEIMFDVSKERFKEVIFTSFAELPDSQHPMMLKYKKARDDFSPNERWGPFFYAGFGFVEPMVEGLKRCGRDLTADNFVKAMESIKDWESGIGLRITYGPNQRQGTRDSYLAKCTEDGKAVRISEWMTSDIDIQEVIKRLEE
jgi:ABC-type branched-subunit amino acid transport system substrate-binding protein